METGVSNPFPTGGPWCEICKMHGHDPYHCPMMQKYKNTEVEDDTKEDFDEVEDHV
jgi:hypothetical protein